VFACFCLLSVGRSPRPSFLSAFLFAFSRPVFYFMLNWLFCFVALSLKLVNFLGRLPRPDLPAPAPAPCPPLTWPLALRCWLKRSWLAGWPDPGQEPGVIALLGSEQGRLRVVFDSAVGSVLHPLPSWRFWPSPRPRLRLKVISLWLLLVVVAYISLGPMTYICKPFLLIVTRIVVFRTCICIRNFMGY